MANGTLAASQIEMLSQSGTGIITITPPATNTNRAITLPDAAGAIVVSGTTPSLNGITFPATQVPSADANTLDDYEEGTWTPVDGSGAGLSFSNTSGNCLYTKIGRTVFASFRVTYPSTADGSFADIGGLPFAAVNSTVNIFPVCFSEQNYVAGTTGTIRRNDTKFLILTVSGGSVAIATNANVSEKDFRGVAIYQTA